MNDLALNDTQKYLLDAFLNFIFSDILERKEPDVILEYGEKIKAVNALLERTVSGHDKLLFKRLEVWDGIKQIHKIFAHPCPQNRSTGSPYLGHHQGMVAWHDESTGVFREEPIGLLSPFVTK